MLSARRPVALALGLSLSVASVVLSGCASVHDDAFATSDADLTAQEKGALEAANTLSLEELTEGVGLSRMVSLSIIGTREGADGRTGTADDVKFATMTDLRNVPLFNAEAEDLLLSYADMLEESSNAPWRKGLPNGKVSGVFSGVTILENTGVAALQEEMAARVSCKLSGNHPGEVFVTCEVPRSVWGCGVTSGLSTCSYEDVAGSGEHGDFSEATGVIDAEGFFAASGGPLPMAPGTVHVAGSLVLENDKITGIEVTSVSMRQVCMSKYCRNRVIHNLGLYDEKVVLRAPDANQVVTNLDYLACYYEGKCLNTLSPDAQDVSYSMNFLPNREFQDALIKRPMDPVRANRIAADWYCSRTWEWATGKRPKARMSGAFGEFSCNVS